MNLSFCFEFVEVEVEVEVEEYEKVILFSIRLLAVIVIVAQVPQGPPRLRLRSPGGAVLQEK